MFAGFLKDLYSRIPIVRDYLLLGDSLREAVALNRELNDRALELRFLLEEIRLAAVNRRTADAIRLFDFELSNHPRYADTKRLLRYAVQVSSQNGEDGMIREIFQRIGVGTRVFVEIGVGDGRENNTAFLLAQGWHGYWIDGAEIFMRTIEARPDLRDAVSGVTAVVTKENVLEYFRELGIPTEFDILSIDVDQNTYHVWESLRNYRPRVVVVEYNAVIPSDIEWKVRYDPTRAWDGSINFGASLKAYELLGRDIGYSLVGCDFNGANAFFVRADLVADRFAEPYTSENHYEPPRYAMWHRRSHRSAILDRQEMEPGDDRKSP